jgi:hypothetical protein
VYLGIAETFSAQQLDNAAEEATALKGRYLPSRRGDMI